MESNAGGLPKVAMTVKRLLSEGKRSAAIRVAGGSDALLRLQHLYNIKSPQPIARSINTTEPVVMKKVRLENRRNATRKSRAAELARMRHEVQWRLDCVERVVCAVFNVSKKALPGQSQSPPQVAARLAFCVLARELIDGASNNQITGWIARNHATLMHYQRRFPKRMEDEWFATLFNECRSQLKTAFAVQ
jgi:hypothetical protein